MNCARCSAAIDDVRVGVCGNCYEELKTLHNQYFPKRPPPIREIDQFFMDFDSLVSQCSFMAPKIINDTISCFGGYDGTGIISAFFNAKKIFVIDISNEILDWYTKVGDKLGFNIETFHYDAKKTVPEELTDLIKKRKISLWRTDPPYNCSGMQCFLNRIFYCSLENGTLIYLCIPIGSEWGQLVMHDTWAFIKRNGYLVTEASPFPCKYPDLEGMTSCVWLLSKEKHVPIPNQDHTLDIYSPTNEFCWKFNNCHYFKNCSQEREEWKLEKKRIEELEKK